MPNDNDIVCPDRQKICDIWKSHKSRDRRRYSSVEGLLQLLNDRFQAGRSQDVVGIHTLQNLLNPKYQADCRFKLVRLFAEFFGVRGGGESLLARPPTLATPQPVKKGDVLSRVLRKKMVRLGAINNPPMIELLPGENGAGFKAFGLYANLMSRIASAYGLRIHWEPVDLLTMFDPLDHQDLDAVVCVFQSPTRALRADFAAMLYHGAVAGVCLKESANVSSLSELLHRIEIDPALKIFVSEGEFGHELMTSLTQKLDDRDNPVVRKMDISVEDLLILGKNRGHIAIADAAACMKFVRAHQRERPAVRLLFDRFPLDTRAYAVMVAKSQPRWRNWLDQQFHLAHNQKDFLEEERHILADYSGLLTRRFA